LALLPDPWYDEVVKTIKEMNKPALYPSKVEVVSILREAAYNAGDFIHNIIS